MSNTFSENWYKVANIKCSLRPNVSIRKQTARNEVWYMLHDPLTGNFYKLSPSYFKFVTALSFNETVEESWVKSLESDPENAPGQQDVVNLLIELNSSGLIYFEKPKDSLKLYKKATEKKNTERKNKLKTILFFRFPIWNPDRWLKKLMPLWNVIFGKFGAAIWLLTIIYGIKIGIENADMFAEEAKTVISPNNIFLLYICVALIKVFHEIGHGAVCVRYGGHINTIGILLLLFTPLPYIDASASWAFRNKWERIYVSSAGMLVEVFLGAIACVIWVNSPPGLVHTIAYNLMFTATVSTVLFNANPLIRYDGYYILADMLEIPNLSQRSTGLIYAVFQRYVFKIKTKEIPAANFSEGLYLVIYGVASVFYRIFLFVVIALFISDRYFVFGMLLCIILTATWIYTPLKKYFKFLFYSKDLYGLRARAIRLNIAVLAIFIYLVGFLPVPHSFVLPGVVEGEDTTSVVFETEGQIVETVAENFKPVKKGDVLFKLKNPFLDKEIEIAKIKINQIDVASQQSILRGSVEDMPIEKRKEAFEKYYRLLLQKKEDLVLKAPVDGYWVMPDIRIMKNQWVTKGDEAGVVVNDRKLRFVSVAGQERSSELFDNVIKRVELRLLGLEKIEVKTAEYKVLPHSLYTLPSAALGWKGGGEIPVDPEDGEGVKTVEPFYLFYTDVINSEKLKIYHGQTGKLKIVMKPEPLSYRVVKFIRQFLQERYKI